MDLNTLLLASAVFFIASMTQSLIGFGSAIIAAPLLYMIDPDLVPIPITILGFCIALLMLYRERGDLSFNGTQFALLGRLPGGIIGVYLLISAPKSVLGIAISLIVFIAILLSIFKFQVTVNKVNMFIAGALSGIFSQIAAIGGPPMAILLAGKEAKEFRSTLSFYFLFSCVLSLIIYFFSGLLTQQHFLSALYLLPSVLFGYYCSGFFIHKVDKILIKKITLALCAFCATLLMVSSLTNL